MSSNEDETKAASVLSQMSKSTKQASENVTTQQIDNNSVIAHQCDVETTTSQEITPLAVDETLAASTPVSAKVYPCEYCGKVFNKSYNLKTHHRVHSGERPYQCAVCGHGFANLGDLKRHDRTHTGEKPYTCEYCNKCFSDFGSHKRHLRLHTGYKPFKCEKCDREFTRLDSYKNHVRLHTGVRPYKCEECQKEFNYLTTYKRHQNIHSGERPYSCDQCGRKFTRLIYVKNHQQNNCGKQKGKKSQTSNEEVVTSSDTTVVAMSDVSALGEALKLADNSVIENIAHDLSMQGGVQLNVTNVIYSNGEAQPFLIESGETTSHTLILTTNPEDRQQLLELAGANNKAESNISPITSDSPGTMFLTHSLPMPTAVSESEEQHGAVVTVKQEEHGENTELGCEVETGEESQLHGKSTEITSEDQEGCNLDPNAMYIAIDPTQRIIGDICASVNSES